MCAGLVVAALAGLAACGTGDDTLRDAAVATQVRTMQDIDGSFREIATQTRQVYVRLRPRCDGEGSDCEGTYYVLVQFRFTPGRPGSYRCIDEPTSVGFTQNGSMTAVPISSSGGVPTPSTCLEGEGGLTVSGTLAMSGDPGSADPRASFGVSMEVSVDRSGTVRYRWSGRDGARCGGIVPTETDAVRRSVCAVA